jgi:hypothetical protein
MQTALNWIDLELVQKPPGNLFHLQILTDRRSKLMCHGLLDCSNFENQAQNIKRCS